MGCVPSASSSLVLKGFCSTSSSYVAEDFMSAWSNVRLLTT